MYEWSLVTQCGAVLEVCDVKGVMQQKKNNRESTKTKKTISNLLITFYSVAVVTHVGSYSNFCEY